MGGGGPWAWQQLSCADDVRRQVHEHVRVARGGGRATGPRRLGLLARPGELPAASSSFQPTLHCHVQVGNSKYYFYTLSVNGEAERHGGNYAEDYLTDLLHARALEFLDSRDTEKPFLLVVAPPASHAPFTPAPQYQDRFPNLTAPRLPSFNVDSGATKHWLTRQGDRGLI